MKRNLKNSATARAGRVLKILIDNPHTYTVKMLAAEFETIGIDGVKDIFYALRAAGWEVICDDYPDYTYYIRGYRKTFKQKEAKEIIKREGLSKDVLPSWRYSGRIPNKYFSKEVVDKNVRSYVLSVLQSEFVKTRSFLRQIEVDEIAYQSLIHQNTEPPKKWFEKIENAINKISKEVDNISLDNLHVFFLKNKWINRNRLAERHGISKNRLSKYVTRGNPRYRHDDLMTLIYTLKKLFKK